MAEGLLNTLFKSKYQAFSAGITPRQINPYAIEVMKELGIDISDNRSKSIEEFRDVTFDFVVTVCDNAKEICPFFPGKKILHRNFEDPADFNGEIEETFTIFRKVRDEIKVWIINNFDKI
jgi:arsenate reductase